MPGHRIVVLTSGDPLFFSVGVLLVRRLGARRVRILPNVTAVAAAFAKLGGERIWKIVAFIQSGEGR